MAQTKFGKEENRLYTAGKKVCLQGFGLRACVALMLLGADLQIAATSQYAAWITSMQGFQKMGVP